MGLCVFFTKHIIKIAIFAVVVVLFFYFYQFSSYDLSKDLCINTTGDDAECLSKDAARWGTFGDFFGGTLNPILSFLALFIVLKTYLSQQEELQETRQILKEQSETQKRQQFDSTFFALLQELKSLNESLKDISIKKDVHRDMSQLSNDLLLSGGRQNDLSDEIDEIRSDALRIFDKYPQFKILFQLLEFIAINSKNDITENLNSDDIEKSDLSHSERIYGNIIKALLPNDLKLVVMASLYIRKDDNNAPSRKYKALIKRYELFEHLSFDASDEEYKKIWQTCKDGFT